MTRTVVLVEDEPDVAFVVRLALERGGYEVVEASTGEDAVALILRRTPDALVLDIRLPGIDGWEVLERLRDVGALESVPVVVLSAHATRETRDRAARSGCAYLAKPFRPDDLVTLLGKVLG